MLVSSGFIHDLIGVLARRQIVRGHWHAATVRDADRRRDTLVA
jgi:hypothetical protein